MVVIYIIHKKCQYVPKLPTTMLSGDSFFIGTTWDLGGKERAGICGDLEEMVDMRGEEEREDGDEGVLLLLISTHL